MLSLEGSQEWQREPSVWLLEVRVMEGEHGGHKPPSHLKELEGGVQLKKSWLIWRG